MLRRYQRPGGFKQLLTLVETSGFTKREQLLKLIAAENRRWADELKKRTLSMDKVLAWGAEEAEKVLRFIPEQTWPKALFHLAPEERALIFAELIQFFPHGKQKYLLDHMSSLNPGPSEVDAAHTLVIKKVRELQASGDFRPERIDPNLTMDGLDKLVI